MLNVIIGHQIKEHRLKRGWTQERLGEILSVSHQVVSKWENAVTLPDVQMLYNLAQLFQVGLDELCGTMFERVCESYPLDEKLTLSSLGKGWQGIEIELQKFPFNIDLLVYALRYLRLMHDRIETDEERSFINAQIHEIASRILDVSTDDDQRSLAHYNLAVYYDEQVNRQRNNEQDRVNAKLAREHAEKVLYKDMHNTFYVSFGTSSFVEDVVERQQFLMSAIETVQIAAKNLLQMQDVVSENKKLAISNFFERLHQEKEQLAALLLA